MGNSCPWGVGFSNKTGRTPRHASNFRYNPSLHFSQGRLTRLVTDWWLGCSFDVSSAESQQEGFTPVPQPSPPWALSLCMQRAEGPQIWAEPWNLDGTSGEAGGRPGPLGYHGVTVPPAPPACGVPVARSSGSPDGMSLSASSRACSSEDTGCPVVRAPGCPLGPLVPQGEGDRGPLQLCSTRS